MAAVVISCINFFVETGVTKWCCKIFPFVEAWLTIILPIIVVILLNFLIYKKTEETTTGEENVEESSANMEALESVKSMGLMVGAFLVCYFPLIVKWHYCGYNSFTWSLMAQALVQANSFMNPFIYAFQVKEFQRELLVFITEDPLDGEAVEDTK